LQCFAFLFFLFSTCLLLFFLFQFLVVTLAERKTRTGVDSETEKLILDIIGFFEVITTKSETSGCDKLSDLNDGLAADGLRVESFAMINLALDLLLELSE
jgi:hypothetical protein